MQRAPLVHRFEKHIQAVTEVTRISANRILEILRDALGSIGELPEMTFAVSLNRWARSESEIWGELRSIWNLASLPGIPVARTSDHYPIGEEKMIIITPGGLGMYPLDRGNLSTGLYPNTTRRMAEDCVVIRYGQDALRALGPRTVLTRHGKQLIDRGTVAQLGQEYCRCCGHIAPAEVFFGDNSCPKPGCPNPASWQDISVG